MQYLKGLGDDLKSGYSTYVLQHDSENISFFAYTGDTAVCSNERALELNAYNRGYFLRKGFSEAICKADPNVIVPVYKDNQNNDVIPISTKEAVRMIYEGKLNISGFKFVEGATDSQKEEVINKCMSKWKFLKEAKKEGLMMAAGYYLAVIKRVDAVASLHKSPDTLAEWSFVFHSKPPWECAGDDKSPSP